jgi:DNA-binding NtrC family response regulator
VFGRRAAAVDAAVLITGESGTGKGLLARAIHAASRRVRGPFVAVNCAGVPDSLFESEFFGHSRGAFTGAQQAHKGLLEQAHNGTLLLDEIGELATPLQDKLLTAIEEGEFRRVGGERVVQVDLRVVAATSADLEAAVAAATFRRDLYHRLLVLSFRLPPLRERGNDIDLFIETFLDRLARKYQRRQPSLEPDALAHLRAAPWPGNIRQLAHTLEAAILACDGLRIGARHLPDTIMRAFDPIAPPAARPIDPIRHEPGAVRETWPTAAPRTFAEDAAATPRAAWPGSASATGPRYSFYGTAEAEQQRILDTLRACRGNKTRAAAALGMARNTLRAKLAAIEEGHPVHGGTDGDVA